MREVSGTMEAGAHEDETSVMLGWSAEGDYTLYPQRWLVLASFCLLSGCNAWMWVTWSPLTALVADYWSVPESSVDALSGVFMYVFVPTNIVSMWLVVNHLGLAKGLKVGATLNMLGALLRYGGPFIAAYTQSSLTEFQLAYMGSFLCAIGQTFILPMIALLSGSWFGEEERATATSLGVLASQTGTLLGLGSTAIMDFRVSSGVETIISGLDPTKLGRYLQLQCLVASVTLLLVVVNVTADRPPTPPSEAAALLTRHGRKGMVGVPYMESVRMTLLNPSSRRFFGVFGLAVGVFYALPTFLSQFMPGWPPQSQGLLGVIFQVAAVAGCSAAGSLVGSFQLQYKKILLWLLGGCLACTVLYLLSVHLQSSLAMVACGWVGLLLLLLHVGGHRVRYRPDLPGRRGGRVRDAGQHGRVRRLPAGVSRGGHEQPLAQPRRVVLRGPGNVRGGCPRGSVANGGHLTTAVQHRPPRRRSFQRRDRIKMKVRGCCGASCA